MSPTGSFERGLEGQGFVDGGSIVRPLRRHKLRMKHRARLAGQAQQIMKTCETTQGGVSISDVIGNSEEVSADGRIPCDEPEVVAVPQPPPAQ